MMKISFCPIVGGGPCRQTDSELQVQKDTFFLAEAFNPKQERIRRELAVRNSIKSVLQKSYTKNSLSLADKDPKEAIFCDICRMIQSAECGICDITGLNPNVMLELGMMLALGKPTFVLVRKDEEKKLKEQLPSDILWKRVVPYIEFIDIQEELESAIRNRPLVEYGPTSSEEVKSVISRVDPKLSKALEARFVQVREEVGNEFRELLRKVNLDATISDDAGVTKFSASTEKRLNELYEKVGKLERLAGVPYDPELAFLRANWHYHRNEYSRAAELYDWVTELNPKHEEAWHNMGYSLDELGKYKEAVDCYDKAIELKPDYVIAWNNKGCSLNNLGKYKEAVDSLNKAIELRPDYVEAWNNKGNSLDDLGKYKEAVDCYDKAIELKPDYVIAWSNKGNSLNNLGKYKEAIDSINKAIELRPDYSMAWINKGNSLDDLGKYKEAVDCYDKAIELKPDFVEAWYNKGCSLDDLGKYKEAVDSLNKAIELRPDFAKAWYNMGIVLGKQGNHEKASECFRKAKELEALEHTDN